MGHACTHVRAHVCTHTQVGWARSPCLAGCQETRPRAYPDLEGMASPPRMAWWLVASVLPAEEESAAGHRWWAASQTICRAMETQGSWATV